MKAAALLALVLAQPVAAQDPTTRIEPAESVVDVDGSVALRALRGANAIPPASVRWVSLDPDVASVDQAGTVTGLRPGETRIAAILDDGSAYARITVPALPPARIDVSLPVDPLYVGTSAPLRVTVLNRLGEPIEVEDLRIEVEPTDVAAVDPDGRVTGIATGSATVRIQAGSAIGRTAIEVRSNPIRSYHLEGPGPNTRPRTGDVVRFRLSGRDADGREVGPLVPQWSISGDGATVEPGDGDTGVFVAEKPGRYTVTAYLGPDAVERRSVEVMARNRPGRLVALGHGLTVGHHAGDTWAFEGADGRDYAYIGTFHHDWMKVFDITDPTAPALTDSIQLDARRINDVKIHPNNRLAVVTREGASNRRNGIVLLDLAEPAHPTILSEYTETVTGGVHNVWIRGDLDLVYACHNGTNEMHIIDISDPLNPREVGRWGLDKPVKTLHDVIVQDGYAYLSYWDDGLVMLDVGAGTHDGTPTRPTLVSRFSYPEGNTHVAWRDDRYVYIGDEIFPSDWDPGRPIEARGFVHVVDYADPDNPVEVARYEVPEAGAHNLWVEDGRLYVGYYQAGLRVVDVSGELRGDLYSQGRELGVLRTASPDAVTPNWSMTWGAQVFKGNIITADLNSGLWIARYQETTPVF